MTIRRAADPMIGIADPNEGVEAAAASTVSQAKLKSMGLALPDAEIDRVGGWATYAAQLTPYIQEFGTEEAQRLIARTGAADDSPA